MNDHEQEKKMEDEQFTSKLAFLNAAVAVGRQNLIVPDSLRPQTVGAQDALHALENAVAVHLGYPAPETVPAPDLPPTERLLGLLDSARDFIVEGGSIRMIGAPDLVREIDAILYPESAEISRNPPPPASSHTRHAETPG